MKLNSGEKANLKRMLTKVSQEERLVVYAGFANGVVYRLINNLNPFKDVDYDSAYESTKKVLKLLVNEVNEITIVDKSLLENVLLKSLDLRVKPFMATSSEIDNIVYTATNVESCLTLQGTYFSKAEVELFNSKFELFKSAMITGRESKNLLDTVYDEYFN